MEQIRISGNISYFKLTKNGGHAKLSYYLPYFKKTISLKEKED